MAVHGFGMISTKSFWNRGRSQGGPRLDLLGSVEVMLGQHESSILAEEGSVCIALCSRRSARVLAVSTKC
jgi:hypothetical protein